MNVHLHTGLMQQSDAHMISLQIHITTTLSMRDEGKFILGMPFTLMTFIPLINQHPLPSFFLLLRLHYAK